MTLEDLGNLGDFLGGIAVIVTLVYLALQIRSNTQTVRAASLESVVNSHSQFLDRLASDSELSRIWFSGLWAGAELTPGKASAFLHFCSRQSGAGSLRSTTYGRARSSTPRGQGCTGSTPTSSRVPAL